jgi:exopolysaccharide biosynthesis polyprenyl glycosylphosphotransferase
MVVASIARIESPVRPAPEVAAAPTARRRSLADVTGEIKLQTRTRAERLAKRTIDIVGSVVGLVTLAPVFAVTAIAVRATSPGPVLFVQHRCGLGGRLFQFYKFRTMVVDAAERRADLEHLNEMQGPVFKIAGDPRMTRLGAVLRKLSVDELPQLWNVLKGDMSLVGPRPPMPCEVERYTRHHAQRLGVIPGITGLWQVSGRSEIPEFDRWLELDLEYARTWSLWLDLIILLKTPIVVLTTRGAL